MARVHRRRAAGRRRRPARPARRRRRRSARRGSCTRSLRRLLELPDDCRPLPSHYSGSVCGRGLSANPVSHDRLRARAQPMLALRRPDAFAAALLADIPPRPAEQARSSPPTAAARPSALGMTGAVRLGLRENAAQFSLLVAVNAFVGAMVGLERSTLPLIGATTSASPPAPRCCRSSSPSGRQGAHQPRRRRPRRARSAEAAADRRLGGRAAGAAADRARARAGAGSSPPTSCSASTRASPGR